MNPVIQGEYFTSSWEEVTTLVLSLPCHSDLNVDCSIVPHPTSAGFLGSIGEPQGQIADYRKPTADLKSIHVRVFGSFYAVHWDKRDPHIDPIGHLVEDAPFWGIIAAICVVAIAYSLYRLARIVWRALMT